MPNDSSPITDDSAWSEDALIRLDAMTEYGVILEHLSSEEGGAPRSKLKEVSATLAQASEEAIRWLDGTPAPDGDESGAAEMRAAAGVYRNAAWMARRRRHERQAVATGSTGATPQRLLRQARSHAYAARSILES